ncbi:MAG: cyclase family protein [Thermoleophilia bacterium]|nr:cyclase family protein [Thermoleophilia bacterium]
MAPSDPPVVLQPFLTHDRDGFAVTQICLGSHSGTHIDAPRHFFPDGAALTELPVDRFIRRTVVLDVRPTAEAFARGVPAEALEALLRELPPNPGDFVLLWTNGAHLPLPAAQLLLGCRPSLVGTDGPSFDPPGGGGEPADRAAGDSADSAPYPVHRLLLGAGIILAENLCSLDEIAGRVVTCAILPLALDAPDGAPVRAVAWY